jgi:hypothetical protein
LRGKLRCRDRLDAGQHCDVGPLGLGCFLPERRAFSIIALALDRSRKRAQQRRVVRRDGKRRLIFRARKIGAAHLVVAFSKTRQRLDAVGLIDHRFAEGFDREAHTAHCQQSAPFG